MIPLSELLADHDGGHSPLQMDSFITARHGGTAYGCYKQALRELHARFSSLRSLYVERALLRVDVDELKAVDGGNEFDQRRQRINLAAKRLGLQSLDAKVKTVEREFLHFYGQASALRETLGELTTERREALDREMWVHRLKCRAAIDLATTDTLQASTIEILHSLPPEVRKAIIASSVGAEKCKLIDWYFSEASEFTLPSVRALPSVEVKRLVESTDAA